MSGRASKQKGSRFELAVAKALGGVRVPMSGAVAAFPGDVVAEIGGRKRRLECKKRAAGFKQIYGWLRDNYALVIGADRQEPLIVLRLADFVELKEYTENLDDFVQRVTYPDDTPDTPSDLGRTGN